MAYFNSIKNKIKSTPFGGLATRIGDLCSYPNSIMIYSIRFAKKGSAILIGSPAHHNIGDHLLAVNEKHFLTHYCKYAHVYEIPTRIYQSKRRLLKRILPKEIPIFITGGGWMGDIWPEDQEMIESIISDFSNNTIIAFPQTIFYKDFDRIRLNITKEIFSRTKLLILMCREENSYYLAKKNFESDNVQVCLFPDMGLYQFYNRKIQRNGIGICLREDREKDIKIDIEDVINQYAYSKKLNTKYISTIAIKPIPLWKRSYVIKNLIKQFEKFDVVITDRLHGMIFSVITGTRCIAIDNITHKVNGVYDKWLSNYDIVELMEKCDQSDVETLLNRLCEKKEIQNNVLTLQKDMEINMNRMAEYIVKLTE